MYKVVLYKVKYDFDVNLTDTEEVVAEEFVGAIRADVSPSGVIGLQEWSGKQSVLSLHRYSRMETFPMEDEEILATPGLGEWYQEQLDEAALTRNLSEVSESS